MVEDVGGLGRLASRQAVLAVCGPSGCGKTTLLEQAIPRLVARGLKVAVLKHDVHGVSIDPAGKDSARLFAAGADVVLDGPGESLTRRHHSQPDIATLVTGLLADHDLVLVEGHKRSPLPKVWLGDQQGTEPPLEITGILGVLPAGPSRLALFLELVGRWLEGRWQQRRLLGGLLVGGAATRMGRPKQLLEYAGSTLLELVHAAVEAHVDRVVLLGGGACARTLAGLPRLPDVDGANGPLAGMLAAFRWAPDAAWVFAPCDVPLVTAEAVAWLVEQRRPGRWAILPRAKGEVLETLLAAYEPQAGALLEAVAAAGHGAPRHIANHPAVVSPRPPSRLVGAWFNVNTPAELAAITEAEVGGGAGERSDC